jgi:salicylate hydroxylase
VATPNTILIAGAGIGGLTAALALAGAGFQVVVFEAARELSEAGAGIQLSPNATRVLAAMGLADALRPCVSAPTAIHVLNGRSGRPIASIPLGSGIEARYGAPYWVVHRADLQRILLEAVAARPEITLRPGFNVLDHAVHAQGVTVAGKTRSGVMVEEQGDALVGADGLWSTVRRRLGYDAAPRFRHRTAWRALIDAADADPAWCEPATHLWLGRDAHLVHYPVRGGEAVNIVAIVTDRSAESGWSGTGDRDLLLAKFRRWSPAARAVVATPAAWQTWSLYDLPSAPRSGEGRVTLLGDAAHAMLPFLAQGAAMAIEDAAVLADCAAREPLDLGAAFRAYEGMREPRTTRAAQASAHMGTIYHLGAPLSAARDYAMRRAGGERLMARQDWLYRWPG